MNTFLQLPAERRRLAFQQVDESMGLQAFSVEKDFWVCWTLRELYTLPCIGEHLTFKGGTSLSKPWSIFHYPSVFPAACLPSGSCSSSLRRPRLGESSHPESAQRPANPGRMVCWKWKKPR